MIYFISDAHLGSELLTKEQQHEQERRICALLDVMRKDATEIYLLGDMIDFWFEYKRVVPKGFARFFGKLAELTDQGIRVHYFTGNHDIWAFDYLQEELGLVMHYGPEELTLAGKNCLLAHGDGMDKTDMGFKIINWIFHNRFLQILFRYLMPSWIGMWFGLKWSKNNRLKEWKENEEQKLKQGFYDEPETPENLFLVKWAKRQEECEHKDLYVFGHMHVPVQLQLKTGAQVVILGDLMQHWTYGQLNEQGDFVLNYMED